MWSGKRGQGVEMAVAIAIMVAGLIVFLRPLLVDGLGRAPGDLGDSRFIHYLLEHSWQWVTGNPRHPLWDPPYYFPVSGVGVLRSHGRGRPFPEPLLIAPSDEDRLQGAIASWEARNPEAAPICQVVHMSAP